MRVRKWQIIAITGITMLCLSFNKSLTPGQEVAKYYDLQLDGLLSELRIFQTEIKKNSDKAVLLKCFLNCRTSYKKTEFLADLFDPYKSRLLNGPDLIKIDEDNPQDSIMPHGFQVAETILYGKHMDKSKLSRELDLVISNITALRKDPDRIYYFKDEKVWQCARYGVYRIISLGITGFDVPLSDHALPEARAALASIHKAVGYYKKSAAAALWRKGDSLFTKADAYLGRNSNFKTFDRLTFVRDHLNPISEWLLQGSKTTGSINEQELYALNANAKNLFAPDVMNLQFFSINEKYRLTQARIALGKKLFYDTRLSGDGSRSCASCHQPQKGFADGLAKPTDLSGNKTLRRNTPTVLNAALQMRQFYDSRTETLENQLNAVVHNTDEMNGSLKSSVPRLAADKEYLAAFERAYPADKEFISTYNIGNAIASYVRSLVSMNSRFDKYIRKETDSFTASEKNGFNLFMGKARCGTCHYAPVFNGLTPPVYQESESEILGVPASDAPKSEIDSDPGKYGFTTAPIHRYAFKTPTVRNIALTAPYMHNGVFKTLDDVVSFYNDGGGEGRGIVSGGQTLPKDKLHLTRKEMKDIVAFMNTLTDTSNTTISYYKIPLQ